MSLQSSYFPQNSTSEPACQLLKNEFGLVEHYDQRCFIFSCTFVTQTLRPSALFLQQK